MGNAGAQTPVLDACAREDFVSFSGAFCDVKYQPPRGEKLADSPGDGKWRGEPGGDNYYSFMRGKLDKGDAEIYLDGDWKMVLGAIEQIKNHAKSGSDQPLCIYLPITYPHPAYAVEEAYFSQIERAKIPPRTPAPDWVSSRVCFEASPTRRN